MCRVFDHETDLRTVHMCGFMCRHVTAADVHTMLVIDRSGSMGSTCIYPDNKDIRSHILFNTGLDNVLGVVYEAAYKYLQERSAKAPQDVISFLPFNDRTSVSGCILSACRFPAASPIFYHCRNLCLLRAKNMVLRIGCKETTPGQANVQNWLREGVVCMQVDFLSQPIVNVQHLLARMMQVHPGGGTQFGQALAAMYTSLHQVRSPLFHAAQAVMDNIKPSSLCPPHI